VWPEERVQAVRSGLADRFKIAVPLGAGFGLRQGEILGFSSCDVDRTAMTVRIRRQIKTVRGVMMFALLKRGKERTIPLSTAMLAEIDDHQDRFPSVAVTLPWQSADGEPVTARLLMTGEGGRLYSGDLFIKVVWHGAFRAAGIEYRRRADGMHALRDFYASTLLARAVSIAELADYLGQADPGFTLRTYTHLVPSSHQRAREAVDAVFGRPALGDGLIMKPVPGDPKAARLQSPEKGKRPGGFPLCHNYLSSALVLPRTRRATMSCWICWVPSKMSRILASRLHFSSSDSSV
jgi:integrase